MGSLEAREATAAVSTNLACTTPWRLSVDHFPYNIQVGRDVTRHHDPRLIPIAMQTQSIVCRSLRFCRPSPY